MRQQSGAPVESGTTEGQLCRLRIIVALGVGLAVATATFISGWLSLSSDWRFRPKQSRTQMLLFQLNDYLHEYKQEQGRFPTDLEESGVRRRNDEWGRPLLYRVVGDTFELSSLGRDGDPGGEGWDEDLVPFDEYGELYAPRAPLPIDQWLRTERAKGPLWAVAIAGVLAAVCTWIIHTPEMLRRPLLSLLARLIGFTTVATFGGGVIASLHIPTGH